MIAGLAGNAQEFFTTLSLDTATILTIFVILLIFGMRWGKSFLTNFIVSIYIAGFLFVKFPSGMLGNFDFGSLFNTYNILGLIIFLIFLSIVHVIVGYMLEFEFSDSRIRNTFSNVLLSAGGTVGLMGILYATGIAQMTNMSLSLLSTVFSNELYLFGLLLAPLVLLFLVVR